MSSESDKKERLILEYVPTNKKQKISDDVGCEKETSTKQKPDAAEEDTKAREQKKFMESYITKKNSGNSNSSEEDCVCLEDLCPQCRRFGYCLVGHDDLFFHLSEVAHNGEQMRIPNSFIRQELFERVAFTLDIKLPAEDIGEWGIEAGICERLPKCCVDEILRAYPRDGGPHNYVGLRFAKLYTDSDSDDNDPEYDDCPQCVRLFGHCMIDHGDVYMELKWIGDAGEEKQMSNQYIRKQLYTKVAEMMKLKDAAKHIDSMSEIEIMGNLPKCCIQEIVKAYPRMGEPQNYVGFTDWHRQAEYRSRQAEYRSQQEEKESANKKATSERIVHQQDEV